MDKKRISVFLAHSGVASRRACENIVLEKRVRVNGEVVNNLALLVSAEDKIELDGRTVTISTEKISLALNKPSGFICTVRDDFKRKTVMELLQGIQQRLYPAGRLDCDSRGLLILTNDGELAYKITHPSLKIPKTYIVRIKGRITAQHLDTLCRGFEIEGKLFEPLEVKMKEGTVEELNSSLKITISEGRKRIIRKAFLLLGYYVEDLKRVQIGKFKLGNLAEGKYKILGPGDIKALLS